MCFVCMYNGEYGNGILLLLSLRRSAAVVLNLNLTDLPRPQHQSSSYHSQSYPVTSFSVFLFLSFPLHTFPLLVSLPLSLLSSKHVRLIFYIFYHLLIYIYFIIYTYIYITVLLEGNSRFVWPRMSYGQCLFDSNVSSVAETKSVFENRVTRYRVITFSSSFLITRSAGGRLRKTSCVARGFRGPGSPFAVLNINILYSLVLNTIIITMIIISLSYIPTRRRRSRLRGRERICIYWKRRLCMYRVFRGDPTADAINFVPYNILKSCCFHLIIVVYNF